MQLFSCTCMPSFWECCCCALFVCVCFVVGGGGGFRVVVWLVGFEVVFVVVVGEGGGRGVDCLFVAGCFVVVIVWFWLCVCVCVCVCVWGGGLYDFFISCCWEYYVDTCRVKGEFASLISWWAELLFCCCFRGGWTGEELDYGIYFYLSNLRFDKMFTCLCDTLPVLVMKFSFNPRNSIILNAGAKLQLQMCFLGGTFTCLVNHFSHVHLLYDCILPWRTITVDYYLFPNPSYKLIRPNNILLCSDWFLYPFTLGVYVAVKILFRCAPL